MKRFITSVLTLGMMLVSLHSGAQHIRCASAEHELELQQKYPKRVKQRMQFEQAMQSRGLNKTQQLPITIPVVVHVLYANATQNISMAQIQSQIEVLNADFARLNQDTVNTPAPFAAVASGTTIQFCLAQRDPNGLPTNGVERRSSTGSWSTNDNIKHFNTGGMDAWDPSQYFNMWVGSLSGGVLGYAEFPTGSLSNTYGVVIDYRSFGNTGVVQAPYNLGRTATHEVGHCFNLYHIWGDDGSSCSGSDLCGDTPNQGSENYGCPNYPLLDNCATTNPGVMFMNYMDYVDDGCMNMFTAGQVARMYAVVNNAPYNSLATSIGCLAPVLANDDAGIIAVTAPAGTVCAGNVSPVVTLRNFGSNTLTSVDINYSVNGGPVFTYNWTGSLASLSTTSVTLNAIALSAAGAASMQVYTSQPNMQTDGDPSNDGTTHSFNVLGASAQALPYSEGFEGSFPAAGMTLNNPDNSFTWEQTTLAAKTGLMSVMMNNNDYSSNGEIDEIVLPAVDLTSGAGSNTVPYLSFQVAYQLYTSPSAVPNYSDTLEVMVSTDCGSTYTSVYKKWLTNLTTTTPVFSSNAFVPTANQWRKDSISLAPFGTSGNVTVKFHHITDYENNMYLDDINISQLTISGLNQLNASNVMIYPNPVSNVLNIRINQPVRIEVYSAGGQLVYDSEAAISEREIAISTSAFAQGLYTVRASNADSNYTTRFVKQ